MFTLSLDVPAVQRMVDREHDDTINDPLALLIAAEEELEFDDTAEADPAIGQHNLVEKSS